MTGKIIKDYFSFSRKERIAVIILVFLIIIISLLPYLVPDQASGIDKADLKNLQLQTAQLQNAKDEKEMNTLKGKQHAVVHDREYTNQLNSMKEEPPQKTALFYFDPNSLSNEGWRKLGLRDKTIITIHNYIAKGGRFKSKEDIEKIYGLQSGEAERLMPYVRIAAVETSLKQERREIIYSNDQNINSHTRSKNFFSSTTIDLNKADSSELIALPGIGSKLAARILHFREKLGGYYSVDQVSEIYGLPDSTFQKIRPRITVISPVVPSININTVDGNELKQHPYIKWALANAIVEYRRQHGNYTSLEDLRKIDLVTDEIYKKIAPYLKLE